MADTKPPFQFPQFNMPGFPYANLPQQIAASFGPPNGQFTNGSQYGRWNGVNNNAFGLFPDQFQSLFGSPAPQPMQFQPPYANNGYLGSNQGPGSNPGNQPPPPPSTPPPQSGPPPQQPLPGAVQGPGGTYPMPISPQFIDPNRQPVGGIGAAPPGPPLTGTTSVPPAGFNSPPPPTTNIPPPGATPPPTGIPVNGSPMVKPLDSNLKMAGGPQVSPPQMPQQGLLGGQFTINKQLNPSLATSAAGAKFIAGYNKMNPQMHVTAQDFNRVAQANPGQAFQLAQAGGQPFINAIMAQNGTNQDQMNQWLNNTGYNAPGAFAGLDPALLRSLGIQ